MWPARFDLSEFMALTGLMLSFAVILATIVK
jgi:hypothetical protein